jgi:hypothetical protein
MRKVLFFAGIVFLALPLLKFVVDMFKTHSYTTLEIVIQVILLVVGLFLTLPEPTLRLLEVVPLPAFMHRDTTNKPS